MNDQKNERKSQEGGHYSIAQISGGAFLGYCPGDLI